MHHFDGTPSSYLYPGRTRRCRPLRCSGRDQWDKDARTLNFLTQPPPPGAPEAIARGGDVYGGGRAPHGLACEAVDLGRRARGGATAT